MNYLDELAGPFLARMADASVRAVVLAVVVALLIFCLRRRSAAQHALWGFLAFAMLGMVALRPIVPAAHLHLTRPAVLEAIAIAPSSATSGRPIADDLKETVSTSSPPVALASRQRFGWRTYAAAILLAGMTVFTLRLILGLYMGWRLFRHTPDIAGELQRRFGATVKVVNFEIRESNRVRVPVTVGFARMRIILPPDWREWPAEKMLAVLAHESAHARRHDPLFALLAAANKCVFWFHPLAWWLERRIAVLAEHAADDAGVVALPDAESYARVVIEVASHAHGGRLIWHAAAMNGPLIAQRIQRMLDPRMKGQGKLGVLVRASLALGVGLALWAGVAVDFQRLHAQEQLPATADDGARLGFKTEPSNAPQVNIVEDVPALERRLAADPEDEQTRAQLLNYYWKNKMEEKRIPLALWLIEHHPESRLHEYLTAAVSPYGLWHHSGSPDAYAEARRLWWEQVNEHPQDARVLGNAAYALGAGSLWDEVDLMKRAQAVAPQNWTKPLAYLYSYVLVGEGELDVPRDGGRNPLKNPELAAQIRNDMQSSTDIGLVGMTALQTVELAIRKSTGHEGGSWNFDTLKTISAELVTRAETLDPQNQHVAEEIGGSGGRWSDLMEGVKGLRNLAALNSSSAVVPVAAQVGAEQVVRVGEGVAGNLLQQTPMAIYPELAKVAGVQGTVKLQVQIGKDGHVKEVKVLSGHPLLAPAAVDAVKRSVYTPFTLNGSPVDFMTTVTVLFALPDK
jgi:TonB family protein